LSHNLILATEIKLDDIIHLAAKQRAFHFERQGKLDVNVRTNLSLALEARLYPPVVLECVNALSYTTELEAARAQYSSHSCTPITKVRGLL